MRLSSISAISLVAFVVAGAAHAQQPQRAPRGEGVVPAAATEGAPANSLKERSSYAIGADIGRGLKSQGLDLDLALVARGLADALTGNKMQMTEKECQAAMVELQQIQMTKIANKNKKDGAAFLAENAKKEGVKTLPSGLQYKVIREGKGATPRAADAVTTHYRGTFLDGAEFDSSYRRNEPATFPVKGVIKGWTEALQLMKVGDKWQLYVPSDLAYGPQGRDEIPPNATLIFDIELLDVKPAAADGTLPKPNE
jgi:FKBP-type peptidyl-prolyl cis-trans isomerase FklB